MKLLPGRPYFGRKDGFLTCLNGQSFIDTLGTEAHAFREQTVKNCMDVLRECSGAHDREVALELLGHLGVLQ